MLDLLRHPPAEFKSVIQAHFRIRRQAILDTVQVRAVPAGARGGGGLYLHGTSELPMTPHQARSLSCPMLVCKTTRLPPP